MQTVQLQCGNCHKLMAIAEEHLGGQVQCPHCKTVVQTLRPASTLSPPPAPVLEVPEKDSIFGAAPPVDDLFDEPAKGPFVEMPHEPTHAPTYAPPDYLRSTPAELPNETASPGHGSADETETGNENDLSQFGRRESVRPSMAPQIALIFLVPYSILTTLFIIYLLATQNRSHPFDMLQDPRGKDGKGAPRVQIQHDLPLASQQKVALGHSLRVGSIEVVPQSVKLAPEGNLVLTLRVRNTSDRQTFNPIHDDYLKFSSDQATGKPYTFLEPSVQKRIYGGYVEWQRGPAGQEKRVDDGDLSPGQDELIQITTPDSPGNNSVIQSIVKSSSSLLWRVQLRRGLVDYHGEKVSATTVIGVPFSSRDIQKEGRGKALPQET